MTACVLPRSRISPHLNVKCEGFAGPGGCHVDYLDRSPWRDDVMQTRRNLSFLFYNFFPRFLFDLKKIVLDLCLFN